MATQAKPVLLRHVAFGYTDETHQARFRCEQIVIRVVATTIRGVVADAKDLALFVKEKAKVHLTHRLIALADEQRHVRERVLRPGRRFFNRRSQYLKTTQRSIFLCDLRRARFNQLTQSIQLIKRLGALFGDT